jgi:hypothetical protein
MRRFLILVSILALGALAAPSCGGARCEEGGGTGGCAIAPDASAK